MAWHGPRAAVGFDNYLPVPSLILFVIAPCLPFQRTSDARLIPAQNQSPRLPSAIVHAAHSAFSSASPAAVNITT